MVGARQPVLFSPLENIEFWDCNAELVSQHEGNVFVWNPETLHIHTFSHRDLSNPLATQVTEE